MATPQNGSILQSKQLFCWRERKSSRLADRFDLMVRLARFAIRNHRNARVDRASSFCESVNSSVKHSENPLLVATVSRKLRFFATNCVCLIDFCMNSCAKIFYTNFSLFRSSGAGIFANSLNIDFATAISIAVATAARDSRVSFAWALKLAIPIG